MKWYKSVFFKNPDPKEKGVMGKNIYGSRTKQEHRKRFHWVHYVWKYKLFVPVLLLARRVMGKYLVKKPPIGNHNRNLRLFNDSFEEALKKWHLYYLRNSGPVNSRPSKSKMLKRYKEEVYLRTLKEFANTLFVHDTAYREFINILVLELTKQTLDYYKEHPMPMGHLLFTVDIFDTDYYVLEKVIEFKKKEYAVNAEELLRK